MVATSLDWGFAADTALIERDRHLIQLRRANGVFTVEFESDALAECFEELHRADLLDVAPCCLDDDTGQGILWASTNNGRLWLLSGARDGMDWRAVAFARPAVDFLREGPAAPLLHEFLTCPVKANAQPVLDLLHDPTIGLGLPRTLPLIEALRSQPADKHPRLTVKLSPGCEWLLLIPFDLMAAPFATKWDIEWIATDKSCRENLRQRQQISAELSDLSALLDHTVIFLNTDYPDFEKEQEYARLRRSTELVLSLLSQLQNIQIQIGSAFRRHALRYFVNPDAATVERVLRDPDTWYVMANFHVEHGCWTVDRTIPFTLDRFASGSLSHLRLLRIYHCHSMFGAGNRAELWQSIVGTLLRAGARRVEGSAFFENYSAFLRQLVRLLASERGLGPLLTFQCLEAGVSLKALLRDLDIELGDLQLK